MTQRASKAENETALKLKRLEYKPEEDIYRQAKEEENINPEDITQQIVPNEQGEGANEKNFTTDMSGDDLDIPGSELDDEQETVGSEDEENNHYSLGGDDKSGLDEEKD